MCSVSFGLGSYCNRFLPSVLSSLCSFNNATADSQAPALVYQLSQVALKIISYLAQAFFREALGRGTSMSPRYRNNSSVHDSISKFLTNSSCLFVWIPPATTASLSGFTAIQISVGGRLETWSTVSRPSRYLFPRSWSRSRSWSRPTRVLVSEGWS